MFKTFVTLIGARSLIKATDASDTGTVTNWIYGLLGEQQPATNTHYFVLGGTSDQDECNQLCVNNANCYYWQLNTEAGTCYGQTEESVMQASNIILEGDLPPTTDPRWYFCNFGMITQCNGGGYTCATCEGSKTCVWQSANHVTGRGGGDSLEECEWFGPQSSTTSTTTTTSFLNEIGTITEWIFGLVGEEQPDTNTNYFPLSENKVANFVECNMLCAENSDCYYWQYNTQINTCYGQNQESVYQASNIILDGDVDIPEEQRDDYCNFSKIYECANGLECANCDGRTTCVWKSEIYLTGRGGNLDSLNQCDQFVTGVSSGFAAGTLLSLAVNIFI